MADKESDSEEILIKGPKNSRSVSGVRRSAAMKIYLVTGWSRFIGDLAYVEAETATEARRQLAGYLDTEFGGEPPDVQVRQCRWHVTPLRRPVCILIQPADAFERQDESEPEVQ